MSRTPLGRIIAGSLFLGLAAAVFLIAVPLAGARENVIAGAVLMGFALGWATLAVASTTWSDQPQRWAAVPAVAMALTGFTLLAWPGSVEQDWLAWAWPLATLALVQWLVVSAPRQLRGRAAGLLYVVFAVMALVAIAALAESVLERQDQRAHPMPGQAIDVGGRRLHLRTFGTGIPTVVLISGFGDASSEWGWIAPAVALQTRVCAFDVAGRGWSEAAPSQQDGSAIAADLHALLARANISGPYVLVGHSLGGLYAMIFAARYPADVAGMVLLDSTHPQQFTRIAAYPSLYEVYRRVSAIFPSLARVGVGRVAYRPNFDSLPEPARSEERALWSTARLARSQRDEWAENRATMDQARALQSFGSRPLAVVTAVREAQPGWSTLQDELARLSTNSVHRVLPQATHGSLIYERADAAMSTQAIHDVVAAVRSGQPLLQPQ